MAASVYVLVAAICMAGRFDWATAAEDDALFSASQVEQLLKNLPLDNLAGVQKMAGRFMKEMAAGQKATDGSDAFQETVLAAMKNQGVLDTWKKRLDAMMYNEVDPDTDEDAFQADADIEEKPQPSVYQPSAVPQSLDAMEKVVHQMLGSVDPDVERLMKSAADLVLPKTDRASQQQQQQQKQQQQQQQPSPSVAAPQRVIEAPAPSKKDKAKKKSTEPLDAIVDLAKQYLGQDASDPTLDLLASMASSYMKTELKKPMGSGKSQKKSPTAAGDGLDLGAMMQLASLFSGDSAQNNLLQSLSSLLKPEQDSSDDAGPSLEQILKLGSLFMGQPAKNAKNAAQVAVNPVAQLVLRFLAMMLDLEPDQLFKYYTGFQKMVETDTWSEMNAVLRATTGTDVEAFLDLLDSDETRRELAETTCVNVVDWLQTFIDPMGLKTKVFYVNSYLLQYDYPPINPRHLIDTVSIVVDRMVHDFLTIQIESRPYMKQAEAELKRLLRVDQSKVLDLGNFTQTQLTRALRSSVEHEVIDPVADIWYDYKLASRYPRCARTIVCQRNAPADVRTPLGLKAAVTWGSTTATIWVLSKTGSRSMPSFNELYQAAMEGAHGHNCEDKFQENCGNVRARFRQLNHQEL